LSHKNKLVILTAKHCVQDRNTRDVIRTIFIKTGKTLLKTKVIKTSELLDLALLEIIENKKEVQVIFATRLSPVPPEKRDCVTTAGVPAGEEDTIVDGKVLIPVSQPTPAPNGSTTKYLILDILAAKGFSGGGIYNKHGEIVGVGTAIIPGMRLLFATTHSDTKAFLDASL